MVNRINSIFELEDNKKYVVLNQAIYQGKNFYLLARISDDEKDILNEIRVCEEELRDGVLGIKAIKDPKLLDLLLKYLKPKEKDA